MRNARGAMRCCLWMILCACTAAPTWAQDKTGAYPSRPVRVVVGITPGGALDAITRIAAQKISERFMQTAIVDNRPGGGTILAMDIVAAATPDGYTLLSASETLLLNGVLKRARYNVRKALMPVVKLSTNAYVMIVTPALPVTTVKEFIAHAKARPGALSYGTPGIGTTLHVTWERLSQLTGMQVVHVPYKGGAFATLDVMGGQIPATITTFPNASGPQRSGKVRGLATTGITRMPALPELPTVAEAALPGFEATSSYSFYVPAGVPAAIIRSINSEIAQGMQSAEARKAVLAEGAEIAPPHTAEVLRSQFERDFAEFEKAVRHANIRLQ